MSIQSIELWLSLYEIHIKKHLTRSPYRDPASTVVRIQVQRTVIPIRIAGAAVSTVIPIAAEQTIHQPNTRQGSFEFPVTVLCYMYVRYKVFLLTLIENECFVFNSIDLEASLNLSFFWMAKEGLVGKAYARQHT